MGSAASNILGRSPSVRSAAIAERAGLRDIGRFANENIRRGDVSYGITRYGIEKYSGGIRKTLLVDLGGMNIMDSSVFSGLDPALKKDILPDTILVNDLHKLFSQNMGGMFIYSMALMSQMAGLDWTGRTVLEAGCGDAVPSLFAAKIGADRFILNDIDPLLVNGSRENFRLNFEAGTIGEHKLSLNVGDITDPESRLMTGAGPQITALVNIGCWPEIYSVRNRDAVRALMNSGSQYIDRFVMGGFVNRYSSVRHLPNIPETKADEAMKITGHNRWSIIVNGNRTDVCEFFRMTDKEMLSGMGFGIHLNESVWDNGDASVSSFSAQRPAPSFNR